MLEKTKLSNQEINWLRENRITRISDKKEILIYPMGAERYLSLVLSGKKKVDIIYLMTLSTKIF